VMGRCRDCRWWDGDRNDPNVTYGACDRIIVPKATQRGDPPRNHAYVVAILDPDGIEKCLTHDDDADCHIWLSVGPDFGCVQWKVKPDPGSICPECGVPGIDVTSPDSQQRRYIHVLSPDPNARICSASWEVPW
jgi:hypothetical protein